MKKLIIIIALIFTGLSVVGADDLRLNVDMEKNLYTLDGSGKTYIKISLTGLSAPRDVKRPALNLSLVLDRSGSMYGERMDQAKQAAKYALRFLNEDDILSIITYESEVQVLLPATRVTNKEKIERMIDELEVAGSTALFAGVASGAREVRKFLSKERVNRVVLISDGMANVGPESPAALADLGYSLRKEGISVTTIGLGLGYNEDLMTRLASSSDGNHAFVESPRDLVRIFDKEFQDVLSVAAGNVEIIIEFNQGFKPLRVLNRDYDIQGNRVVLDLNQIYSNQEKYAVVELLVPPGVQGQSKEVATIQVNYQGLFSQAPLSLSKTAQIRYTPNKTEAEQSIIPVVAQAVAVQQIAEAQEEALKLRDEGRVLEARGVLTEASSKIRAMGELISAPALESLADVTDLQAEAIDDEEDWNSNRKEMRSSQYKLQNQMNY